MRRKGKLQRRMLGPAVLLLISGCLGDHPATITYAWSPSYPPALLAVRLGDQRIAGEALEILPGNPNTLEIVTQAPTGTVPLEVSLVSGRDTLAAIVTTVSLRAGKRFTLNIAAGLVAPGFAQACANQLGRLALRGGPVTDSLAVQWYESEPSNLVGPC